LKLEPASIHRESEQEIYSWTTKERSSVRGVEELSEGEEYCSFLLKETARCVIAARNPCKELASR